MLKIPYNLALHNLKIDDQYIQLLKRFLDMSRWKWTRPKFLSFIFFVHILIVYTLNNIHKDLDIKYGKLRYKELILRRNFLSWHHTDKIQEVDNNIFAMANVTIHDLSLVMIYCIYAENGLKSKQVCKSLFSRISQHRADRHKSHWCGKDVYIDVLSSGNHFWQD